MANYNLGGGISGEKNKVDYRDALKFEEGKAFNFSAIDKKYVNFLSCVKSVTVKGVKKTKADMSFNLAKKLFVSQDAKTKVWSASDTKK